MRSFCSPSGPQTATPPTERPGFVWSGPPLLLLLLARMLLSSFLCKKTDYDVVVHPLTAPPKHTHTRSRILHWLPWVLRVLESNPGTKWGWNDCWSNDDVLIYPPKLRRTSEQWAVSSEHPHTQGLFLREWQLQTFLTCFPMEVLSSRAQLL